MARRYGVRSGSTTTPNMVRAKERKKRNRRLKLIQEYNTAKRLKISVVELRKRKFAEARPFIMGHRRVTVSRSYYDNDC